MTQDRKSTRTVFAWAWTLFGNGHLWQRALTWTKDDPFAVEVANPNFKSVAVPLYTEDELSSLPSAPAVEGVKPFADVAADFDADGRVMEDTCPIYANTAGDFRAARRYQQKREAK